jgi:hypothetical protein
MYENADTMAFVPELHMLSMLWEILGDIPHISETIGARYFWLSLVDTKTTSMSFWDRFFVCSNSDFAAEKSSESTLTSSAENFVV